MMSRHLSCLCLLALAWSLPGPGRAEELRLQPVRLAGCQNCQQDSAPTTAPGAAEPAAPGSVGDTGMSDAAADAMSNSYEGDTFGSSAGPSSGVPGMLGDSYSSVATFNYNFGGSVGADLQGIIPSAGRYKCADNTGPIPTDRVSFVYKHFHNALQSNVTNPFATTPSTSGDGHVDSYILGFEKTIFNERASLELRLPFYGGSVFSADAAGLRQSVISTPDFGNVSVIFKTIVYRTPTLAVGGGLGVDLPTADDITGRALNAQDFYYSSQTTYLAPFATFLAVPNDRWWIQGVLQFSLVTGSNELFFAPSAIGNGVPAALVNYTEQDLAFATINMGRWIFTNPQRRFLVGMAGIVELNWTGTMNDAEVQSFSSFITDLDVTNAAGGQSILNLTGGLHFQLTPRSNLRVSGVAPLRGDNAIDNVIRDRYFDGEVSVQFNRLF